MPTFARTRSVGARRVLTPVAPGWWNVPMKRRALLAALTTMTLLAATASPAVGRVGLGGVIYGGSLGEGWGTARPHRIFNGGDLSGLISNVHWSSWGGPIARGHGRHALFKPSGGYYRHKVVAQLKAKRIGRCEGHRAYLKLLVRERRRPGGPLGAWRSWSGPRTICEPYA